MQSTFCSNCRQPLPAGAAFCGNCGARQTPANQNVPSPAPLPPAGGAATMRAGTPPASDYAPTQMQPPPPPPASPPPGAPTVRGDAYAAQYGAPPPPPPYSQYAGPMGPGGAGPGGSGPGSMYPLAPGPQVPMMPSPAPGYAPGPPPVMAPGGGVAPWAQPPKKQRTGLKVGLGCLIALVLVVALLGGGGYLLIKALSGGGKTGQHPGNTPGVGSTPGTGSTPGAGSTPSTGPNGSQTLNNINRQAIYAGVNITVSSATQTHDVSQGYTNRDPDHDEILRIQGMIDNQTSSHGGFSFTVQVLDPTGNKYDRGIGHGVPTDEFPEIIDQPITKTGAWYFEIPKGTKIGDWKLVIGEPSELPVTIPLTGPYDPTMYQEMSHTMGLNQPIKYSNGNITGVITKVITATWNSGYQAPKGMRFLRLYFHVTNNTALPVNVGDGTPPQYVLIYPNGDRKQADTRYNTAINEVVQGAESKDVGFDSWVIDPTPAPYTILFLNPDGSKAGQIDLGTV